MEKFQTREFCFAAEQLLAAIYFATSDKRAWEARNLMVAMYNDNTSKED